MTTPNRRIQSHTINSCFFWRKKRRVGEEREGRRKRSLWVLTRVIWKSRFSDDVLIDQSKSQKAKGSMAELTGQARSLRLETRAVFITNTKRVLWHPEWVNGVSHPSLLNSRSSSSIAPYRWVIIICLNSLGL